MLYHYTDGAGLLGIVNSGAIWATDALYLNDSTELSYGRELATEYLETLKDDLLGGTDDERYLFGLLSSGVSISEHRPAYVACFCEEPDILSQWMGYGRAGGGFALGLLRHELVRASAQYSEPPGSDPGVRTIFDGPEAKLHKVIYDRGTQVQVIAAMVKSALDAGGGTPGGLGGMQREMATALATFKDKAFEAEQEWRLIRYAGDLGARDTTVKFRMRGTLMVPYVEIPLIPRTGGRARDLPLVEIIVGATNDEERCFSAVMRLAQARDFDLGLQIIPSAVPLQT